jgi:hypothetical protein
MLLVAGEAVLVLVLLPITVNVATGGSAPPGLAVVRPFAWYIVAGLSVLAVAIPVWRFSAESRASSGLRYSRFHRDTQRGRVLEGLSARVTADLAATLAGIPWLQPSLAVAADAVTPSDDVIPADIGGAGQVPGDIREAFELFDRNLLILGNPGAGKSTLLLELARRLLAEAEASPDSPVPVLLGLTRWKAAPDGRWPSLGRRTPDAEYFTRWCVSQMAERGVPRPLAAQWLDDDGVVLLLDGLDEMPARARDGFVWALREVQGQRGPLSMAVTCRTAEYATLRPRLGVQGAVEIESLDRPRIEGLLAGQDANADSRLTALRQELDADNALWELLDSPLWLALLAQEAGSPRSPESPARPATRSGLLDRYVDRALASRPFGGRPPVPAPALRTWLATIARSATTYISHWWDKAWQEEDAHALAAGLLPGVALGAACGLAAGGLLINAPWPAVVSATLLTAWLGVMMTYAVRLDTSGTRRGTPKRALLAGFAAAIIASGMAAAALAGLHAIRLPATAIWYMEGPFVIVGVYSVIYQSIRADQDDHPEAAARSDDIHEKAAARAKSQRYRTRQQAVADKEGRAAMITLYVGMVNAGAALWLLVMGRAAGPCALGVAAGAVAGGGTVIGRVIAGLPVPHPVRAMVEVIRPRAVLAVAYLLAALVLVGTFFLPQGNGAPGRWIVVTTHHVASGSNWPFDLLGVGVGFAGGLVVARWLFVWDKITDPLTTAVARAWLASERRLPWRVRRFESFAAGTGLMRLSYGSYVFRHELLAQHLREDHQEPP